MTGRLAGKVALVSGGARGMGASHVRALVGEGAKLVFGGLTKSTALELGPSGIRVNSIHPGLIKTPVTGWVPEDIFQTALGRAAEPVEVSNLVGSTLPATSPATRLGHLTRHA